MKKKTLHLCNSRRVTFNKEQTLSEDERQTALVFTSVCCVKIVTGLCTAPEKITCFLNFNIIFMFFSKYCHSFFSFSLFYNKLERNFQIQLNIWFTMELLTKINQQYQIISENIICSSNVSNLFLFIFILLLLHAAVIVLKSTC